MQRTRARNERAAARSPTGSRSLRRESDNQMKSVAGLGPKLKAARERNGISLRAFARNVDVSPSLVSQIERSLAMPSVGTLYAMVSELGLGLDELFQQKSKQSGNGRQAPAGDRISPVRRANGRQVIRLADGVRWELLTPAPDPELEFLYVVYEVGAESCDKDLLVRHGGMEYAYLISGQLGVRIGFSEYELKRGDSISFEAQQPHRLWTIGDTPAVAIWAVLNRSGDKRTRRRHWVRADSADGKAGKPTKAARRR